MIFAILACCSVHCLLSLKLDVLECLRVLGANVMVILLQQYSNISRNAICKCLQNFYLVECLTTLWLIHFCIAKDTGCLSDLNRYTLAMDENVS